MLHFFPAQGIMNAINLSLTFEEAIVIEDALDDLVPCFA